MCSSDLAEPPAVNVDLPGAAWLPRDYVPDIRAKIDVYRRLSRATTESQVDELATELDDRFGPLPDEARRLLEFARLRRGRALLLRGVGGAEQVRERTVVHAGSLIRHG